jgi:hypothetical protein
MSAQELARLLPLLAKADRRTKGPKWVWVAVILLFSVIGPLLYFVVGRDET